jgi:hypothetical protein
MLLNLFRPMRPILLHYSNTAIDNNSVLFVDDIAGSGTFSVFGIMYEIIYGIICGIWNQVPPRGLSKILVSAFYGTYRFKLLLHRSFSQYTEFHLDTDYDLCTIKSPRDSVQDYGVALTPALGYDLSATHATNILNRNSCQIRVAS